MHLGFLHGTPIVAYKSVEEAIDQKSCLTCRHYKDDIPCQYYGACRAEKPAWNSPLFYNKAHGLIIESRLTTIEGEIQWI